MNSTATYSNVWLMNSYVTTDIINKEANARSYFSYYIRKEVVLKLILEIYQPTNKITRKSF